MTPAVAIHLIQRVVETDVVLVSDVIGVEIVIDGRCVAVGRLRIGVKVLIEGWW